MAEIQIVNEEKVGIAKSVDSGALELIFEAMQSDMYSHPIESFIRETISNGLDSHKEADIAFDILSNKAPVEKYYLQRTDDKLLKDSSFNPGYYNLKHLSPSKSVEVSYEKGTPRDLITIRDFGVGLGSTRLRGFFNLG